MTRFKSHESGFTVIEVMLFLAISGTLAVGILASSTIAINSQRYRDATNTLQSTLQQQYNQTAHVVNVRSGDERCNTSGVAAEPQNGGEDRGSSECLVMGRYAAVQPNGTIRLANIIGIKKPTTTEAVTETEELQNYTFFADPSTVEQTEVAWGGQLTFRSAASPDQPIAFGENEALILAVLRSPLSGVTRTYVAKTRANAPSINSAISAPGAQGQYKICVEPSLFSVSTPLGILIRERATSAGAIELLTEDSRC